MADMNTVLQQMMQRYSTNNSYEQKNAMKEVMQEIVLYGLSKAGFFQNAAFYGGTALRLFYGLDRFSEDLDFSLMMKQPDFDLSTYFPILRSTIESFGLHIELQIKEKQQDSNIKSAFLKGDTIEQFLLFYPKVELKGIHKDEKIKIKFEVDVNPPAMAKFETRFRLLPAPHEVRLYDEESLFAGKLHAVICRAWKNRVKGRDLYDYVFYLSRNIKFNLPHLRERLIDSHFISESDACTITDVKEMLIKRFEQIDYDDAKKDIEPFIKDREVLNIWSKEFFIQITEQLATE